jgi:hypothetical protein
MYRVPIAVGVLLLAGLSLATGQDIKVRLVNAKSGKPLSKVTVSMQAWIGTFDIHKPDPKQIVVEATATTNGEGVAVFHITQPAPEHIGFLLQPPMDFYGCWGQIFSPEIVLRGGVADYNQSKCGRLRKPISAEPGDVVIVERKLTAWEHMRREMPWLHSCRQGRLN